MKISVVVLSFILLAPALSVSAQRPGAAVSWIMPETAKSPAVWGIHNGIVAGLYPASIDGVVPGSDGGPRGLLRIGYEHNGVVYLINFIAVEPVVNGDMEFSEISPSTSDGKLGKQFWASDSVDTTAYTPYASTKVL